MSFYATYPKINYSVNDFDTISAVDIHSAYKIKNILKNFTGINYNPYYIKDGERPDQVATQFYGDPSLEWIILFTNEIYSIYDDWPKSNETLLKYIEKKYGSITTAKATTKYYYNSTGDIIDSVTYASLSPSQRSVKDAYDYEFDLNETKSNIKILRTEFVNIVQTQLLISNVII